MSWIHSYSCVSSAGSNVAEFWTSLREGRVQPRPYPGQEDVKAFLFSGERDSNSHDLLLTKMIQCLNDVRRSLRPAGRLGVIFASTKGQLDDFVWSPEAEMVTRDPLTPLLEDFIRHGELQPERQICVSNACSSVIAAYALAQHWLELGLDQVLIVSADAVTPFVIKGFQALKLISTEAVKPFAVDRTGFLLGEAASCVVLSSSPEPGDLALRPVGLDSEGSAVTRPSRSGESVVRAALRIPDLESRPPDVIVAHGTGTLINDETEDHAFAQLFRNPNYAPLITGTKWCVGHTLAVSGALDTIAACEALKRQELFRLATSETIDARFRGRYARSNGELPSHFNRVLVSSLGFGGMHASCLVERFA